MLRSCGVCNSCSRPFLARVASNWYFCLRRRTLSLSCVVDTLTLSWARMWLWSLPMSLVEPGSTPLLARYVARPRRMRSSSSWLQSREGRFSGSGEGADMAALRGRLTRGSEAEPPPRGGESMGRELMGLMMDASARGRRAERSGETLSSSESAPAAGSRSASEATGAAESSESELMPGERALGLPPGLGDEGAALGAARRRSASASESSEL
uniref:Uncharacterized protein n=1 Tax=Triticum urartu TaxID=4572 RepID=A0A8R7QD26_TRIUA